MHRTRMIAHFVVWFLICLGSLIAVGATRASFTPPTTITVHMYRLRPDDSLPPPGQRIPCSPGDTQWGCTANSSYPYPYSSEWATVPIETDYLLDVVSRETPPDDYHSTAVQAEAIAARTYAYWHIRNGSTINNSTDFQVFVPYRFEKLGWFIFSSKLVYTLGGAENRLNAD